MSFYADDVFEGFGVTAEEVDQFGNTHVGLCSVDMSRISEFLRIQLTSFSKHKIWSAFSVTDVIRELEGIGRGCKQRSNQFKHMPLQGFWKAHFFDARFVPRNIISHWGLEFEDSPRFNALCRRIADEEERFPTKGGWQENLAYAMIIEAFEERAKQRRLTGEWIIFSKYNGKNYYLCISRHTTGEEDQRLYDFLHTLCEHEYPFLFSEKIN